MFEYRKKKAEKRNGKTPQIAESFCCLQMMMLRNAQGNYPYTQWKEQYKNRHPQFHVLCVFIKRVIYPLKCIFCLKFNIKKLKHLV